MVAFLEVSPNHPVVVDLAIGGDKNGLIRIDQRLGSRG